MDLSTVLAIVSIALSVVVVVLLAVVLVHVRAQRRQVDDLARARADRAVLASEGASFSRVAVVMNPSKHDDPEQFRERLRTISERLLGIELHFHDTTREDPGRGQAAQALEDGADLVIAAGGDGTVREVASALAHSGVRMAILPVGTGNLLARNLDLPLDDLEKALRVALLGADSMVDMGWMRTGSSSSEISTAQKRAFLVIAGVGADAEVIGATNPKMKRRIGWPAYVVAGLDKIVGRAFSARITTPSGHSVDVDARTVLIGNVGRLPGGIVLMPDATVDNHRLDVLVLSWRGAAGLSQIIARLVQPALHPKPQLSTMEQALTTSVSVVTTKPQPVQLDGDTEGKATHLLAEVDPGALIMRTPASVADRAVETDRQQVGPHVTESDQIDGGEDPMDPTDPTDPTAPTATEPETSESGQVPSDESVTGRA
ncbi:diacylglycerol kinase family protein [Brachybacterium sp. ACRRE]|uniref:diacylglycerol/lipid kinase family protein n=1 Tax=Brachybacterium sp. ACRRE TaxID=2918184 RepID=UPI001EF27F7E|nr:diacylglycerol kinase family protein [Brachybacterium sp. ACRRE]MCG7309057.1 NAD(+)/NADH kinase [Brachybacterium sp. ACRRE]